MYCIKNIICGILLLVVISDLSSADVRLCGKSLTQFLEVICVDGFNNRNLRAKKSDKTKVPLNELSDSGIAEDVQPLGFSSLFMENVFADHNNLMAKTRRRRYDGIAEECCHQSCSMNEFLSYCL